MTISCQKMPKYANIYMCEKCDFKCSKLSNYKIHLSTRKHKMMTHDDTNDDAKNAKTFICPCGKKYKHRQGLYVHRKKCTFVEIEEEENEEKEEATIVDSSAMEIIKCIMKENKEVMMEMCQQFPKMQPHHTTNTTNNTTNNNQIFNINMFLNEQCKDALNMSEFIESIQLTMDDVLKITEQGQTKGMSNILIDKLSSLDLFKRPMHCSDAQKEIIYVKDEDRWETEDKDRPKIKQALDQITKKGMKMMPGLEEKPDEYVTTVNELLKDPREDKKIISELVKNITVKP